MAVLKTYYNKHTPLINSISPTYNWSIKITCAHRKYFVLFCFFTGPNWVTDMLREHNWTLRLIHLDLYVLSLSFPNTCSSCATKAWRHCIIVVVEIVNTIPSAQTRLHRLALMLSSSFWLQVLSSWYVRRCWSLSCWRRLWKEPETVGSPLNFFKPT